MTKTQTRVVILGAGFGGLSVARLLSRSRAHRHFAITLVDKETESVYTPWLHELAAGTVDASALHDVDIALESVRGVRFRRGTVQGVDRVARHVLLADESTIPYDILVIACGSVSNDFDIPGVKGFALDLKRTSDALAIRERVRTLIEEAKRGKRQRLFVVGTGANGVEFAAECGAVVQRAIRRGVLDSGLVSVHLVGATPELLPILPLSLRARARRRLEKLGIVLHLSSSLREVKEGVLTLQPLKDGLPSGALHRESFNLCVTALGVKVPDVVQSFGFAVNERGRIFVDDMLRVRGESAIFALGDVAVREHAVSDPQTAQAAVRQAYAVARNICALLERRSLTVYRSPKRWPIVVTLGVNHAIASLWGLPIWGYTVAILRRMIDARYFLLATSIRETLVRMGRGFLTYGKNDCTKDTNMERD